MTAAWIIGHAIHERVGDTARGALEFGIRPLTRSRA